MHDLIGKRFGKLTVISLLPERKNGLRIWFCKCTCGNTSKPNTWNLVNGKTFGCGCSSDDIRHWNKTPLYSVWRNMKNRCSNKNLSVYKNYGGRGISVSKEWLYYPNFYRDMFPSYEKGKTIERINNDGNYCRENCRWATLIEQGRNKRSNVVVSYKGKKKILADWAKELGLKRSTLYARYRRGQKGHKILTGC